MTIQAFAERDQIDGLLRLRKFNDALENPTVLVKEKVIAFYFLNGNVQGMIVEEDSAEDAALRASAVRERTFESRILGHLIRFIFAYGVRYRKGFSPSAMKFRESECRVQVSGRYSVRLGQ